MLHKWLVQVFQPLFYERLFFTVDEMLKTTAEMLIPVGTLHTESVLIREKDDKIRLNT